MSACNLHYYFFALVVVQFILSAFSYRHQLSEAERVERWYEEGNSWPPSWQEIPESFMKKSHDIEKEIMQINGGRERWENWMQFTQGYMVPTFTKRGFAVVKTPAAVHAKLTKLVEDGLADWDRVDIEMGHLDVVYSNVNPKFINMKGTQWQILEELRPLHEEWAGGMKLVGTSAYGIRMYPNGSSLGMHRDKIHTHVISSIVHIAHKYDNQTQPWPIQIEDHYGNIESVALEPGEMLFYESAKCLHGRLKEFRGQYYGSIFLHYKPADTAIWAFEHESVVLAVPPHWRGGVPLTEVEGSRWAGQSLTVNSYAPMNSQPRMAEGKVVHDIKSPLAYYDGEGPYHAVESNVAAVNAATDRSEL